MPLPDQTNLSWPPVQLERVTPVLDEWTAWWTGSARALQAVYLSDRHVDRPRIRPSQNRGGVVGALSRFWWGRPQQDLQQGRDLTHVPLPSDISRASADLLFNEPPEILVGDDATQAWLEADLEDRLLDILTGAAERASAQGGVYLRVTWDKATRDRAFVTGVPADEALPVFRWGQLVSVLFWTVVRVDGQTVWRHLESHDLSTDGLGLVSHGLYQGTADKLGTLVPLEDDPSTAGLAASVGPDGYVTEGRTPGLNVVYIPNTGAMTAKAWAREPAAKYLGGSDYDGLEQSFDNLDEIYAAWMRDIRLAKARLLVARYMLEDNGPGGGATFNADQEIFSALKMAAGEDGDAPITPVQFEIRFEAHRATAEEWTKNIIRGAGYSQQTFGDFESAQMTATEVTSRDNRSVMTRDRKLRAWRPALRQLIEKLITVDTVVFSRPHAIAAEGVKVTFPDGSVESPLQRAQTAQALRAAEAASTETLVALVNPEWDDKRVTDETAAIRAERGSAADPFTIGSEGVDPSA